VNRNRLLAAIALVQSLFRQFADENGHPWQTHPLSLAALLALVLGGLTCLRWRVARSQIGRGIEL